jgi:hypothetical protein
MPKPQSSPAISEPHKFTIPVDRRATSWVLGTRGQAATRGLVPEPPTDAEQSFRLMPITRSGGRSETDRKIADTRLAETLLVSKLNGEHK